MNLQLKNLRLTEDFRQPAKKEVLKTLEGKSRLEAERELAARAPETAKPEKLRTVNADEAELRITLSADQLSKLKKLKALLSHRNPDMSFADLIEHLADSELKRIDPEQKSERKPTSPGEVKTASKSRYIPASFNTRIWKRAQGSCEYQDTQSGRRCESRFMLEIDHRLPLAKGGKTEESNLRLLCRNHNLHEAWVEFGPAVMEAAMEQKLRKTSGPGSHSDGKGNLLESIKPPGP